MTNFQNASATKNIEIIKQFYSGLNQNDVEAVMALFDANILRNEFEGMPTGGVYRGLAEMRSNLVNGRSTWAEGACEPIEFYSQGNKFVIFTHVKVWLKNESKWIEGHVADGFSLHEGRVTEFHSFTTKQKAFEWAGISDGKPL